MSNGRVKFFTNGCDFGFGGVNFDCLEILRTDQQIFLLGWKRFGMGGFRRVEHFFCRLGIASSTVVIFTLGRQRARARRGRGEVPKVREAVGGE